MEGIELVGTILGIVGIFYLISVVRFHRNAEELIKKREIHEAFKLKRHMRVALLLALVIAVLGFEWVGSVVITVIYYALYEMSEFVYKRNLVKKYNNDTEEN